MALVGGNWTNAALCGCFTLNLNNAASNANANIGARLSYLIYWIMRLYIVGTCQK